MKDYKIGKAKESGRDPYEIIELLENEVLRLSSEQYRRDAAKHEDQEDTDKKRNEVEQELAFVVRAMIARDTDKRLTKKAIRDEIKKGFDNEIKKQGEAAPYGRPLPGSDRRLDEILKPILREIAPYTLKSGRPKKK